MKPILWSELDQAGRERALARPLQERSGAVREAVARTLEQVQADGDGSLRALTRRFDGCELGELRVSAAEFAAAEAKLGAELKQAMEHAYGRIRAFHAAGAPLPYALDTAPGVRCERILRPLDRVGLYVPAGSAPLPSTALMLGVPAQLAGCAQALICSPPNLAGEVDASVLVAARLCGIDEVYKLGGAQAIAAMAFGSESVPACDKLFGPGNAYVTEAKLQVSVLPGGPAIDMPAGPSEVLVIAEAGADAELIAADLLSQAEHGADSQALLLSSDLALARAVIDQLETQAGDLPRAKVVAQSLQHARVLVVPDLTTAFDCSNRYAPEHLILHLRNARDYLPQVRAAGSVFLGVWAAEALGDYCSGSNHVLPTYGAARAYSGVSVASFLRQITVQELNEQGLVAIGRDAMVLAEAEGLTAHARAVSRRLAKVLR